MKIEKYIPALTSILALAIFIPLILLNKVSIKNFDKLIDLSINIAGVLLGFLITLQGILISVSGSKIIKFLKHHGTLKTINSYLKSSIINTANVLIFGLVVIIINFEKLFYKISLVDLQNLLFIFWIALIALMAGSAYRFISIFITVISDDSLH